MTNKELKAMVKMATETVINDGTLDVSFRVGTIGHTYIGRTWDKVVHYEELDMTAVYQGTDITWKVGRGKVSKPQSL